MFCRFCRPISHWDQLSPQSAPEQPGGGGQRHGDGVVLMTGRVRVIRDKTASRTTPTDSDDLTFTSSVRTRRRGVRVFWCACVCALRFSAPGSVEM